MEHSADESQLLWPPGPVRQMVARGTPSQVPIMGPIGVYIYMCVVYICPLSWSPGHMARKPKVCMDMGIVGALQGHGQVGPYGHSQVSVSGRKKKQFMKHCAGSISEH